MVLNEFRYTHISGTDGLPLSVLRIEPDRNIGIKGIIQIAHGMIEHKERYLYFMKYMAGKGYITVIHDHRGHGESVSSKNKKYNDLGYFYSGGYKALIEDIHEITLETKKYVEEELGIVVGLNNKETSYDDTDNSSDKKKTGTGIPYTLLGFSMGSLAVRCYIKKYDNEIDRLCVLGCPSNKPGLRISVASIKLLEKIKGERAHSKLFDYLVLKQSYANKFKDEGPYAWLNTDKEAIAAYANDPLSGFNFTLNGYENLVNLTIETYNESGYNLNNPDLKIKFFSGKNDPCALSYKAFRAAMLLLIRQGYRNVSGKMYGGMRHEILNEREKIRVYHDILEFIK